MTELFDHGGNIFTIARSLGVSPEKILDFSASINPLGFAEGVREAVFSAFDRVLHYPDSDSTELRQALARVHGVDARQIVVANGSTELIHLVPRLLEELPGMNGRRGLIVAPAFSEYGKALAKAGMEVHYLKLRADNGFRLCPDELEQALSGAFDVMFLCNPGNPTGTLIPPSVVEEVIELCRAAGTLLVLDEAFMDFCETDSGKHLVLQSDCGIVLRSMTKFYALPGLRVGYAVASERLALRMESLRGPWSVNTPAQFAGVAALTDTGYVRRTVNYVAGEREFLAQGMTAVGGLQPYPSVANYLLVTTREGNTATELRKELLKRFILIRDCSNFEGLNNRFFRVAVRTREENIKLLEALRVIL